VDDYDDDCIIDNHSSDAGKRQTLSAPPSPQKEVAALLKDALKFQQTLLHQDIREQEELDRKHPYCTSNGNGIGKHILGQGVTGGCLVCIKHQNESLPIKRARQAKKL
jgi:hypothetical protein